MTEQERQLTRERIEMEREILRQECKERKSNIESGPCRGKLIEARNKIRKYRSIAHDVKVRNSQLKKQVKILKAMAAALLSGETDIDIVDIEDRAMICELAHGGMVVNEIADKFAIDIVTAAVIIEWHNITGKVIRR